MTSSELQLHFDGKAWIAGERNFTEETLQLFLSSIEYAPEGVFIISSGGGFFYVNEQACLSLGHSRDELMSLKLWDIDPAISESGWEAMWQRFQKNKVPVHQVEATHRHKNGSLFPVEISAKHLWLVDADYHVAFVRDITDRKQAEEALHMYQFFMEHAPDAVFLMTSDGGFSYVNDRACRSLGYTRQELMGLKLWDIDPVFPKARWDEIIATKADTVFTETLHRRKDGTVFPVEVSAKHLWLPEKGHHVAFVRDISERKQAEAAIQERETRFRSLFEKSADAILLFENGVFTDCNQAAVEMMRATDKQQFLSLHPSVLSPAHQPDGRPSYEKAEEIIRATLEKGGNRFEWIHRRTDGEDFPVEVLLTTINLGGHQAIYTVWRDITERKRAEEALQMYRFSMENAPEGVFFMTRDGGFSYVNETACRSLGYTRDELLSLHLWDIDPLFPMEKWRLLWAQHHAGKIDTMHTETTHRRKDGVMFPVEVSARHLWLGDHELHVAFVRDITERKRAEEELRQLAAVVKNTAEAVVVTDANNRIIAVNKAFTEITGYAEQEALGNNPRILKSDRHGRDFYRTMWAAIETAGLWQGEIWDRRKSGEIFPAWSTISVVRDVDNNIINYVAVFSDISAIKRSQEQLDFLAHHDPLTELPNRLLFNDRLEHALKRAEREGHQVAVLFLDLDRFKNINDSLGHPVGDILLKETAKRITRLIRQEDTVARLGGDEFIILIEKIDDAQDVAHLAKKLTEAVGNPFSVKGHELHLTVSVGISLYPGDGEEGATLVRNADAAMYRAKEEGRNAYQFYTTALTAAAFERLTLENALRHALEKNELILFYQPQYRLKTGELIGAEALIRWQHPDMGLILPSRFISLAEECGLIGSIGEWVLQCACQQMKTWLDAGFPLKRMAVNLSSIQFQRGDIVATVGRALEASGLGSQCLELEITESLVMQKTAWTVNVIDKLKQLGVTISIDDFGTGYSSLSYLKRLPVDKLKIDKSFVRDIPHDPNDEAIARAVIALGQSLNLEVIAEGVETEEQHQFLAALGCDEGQGHWYGPPVVAEEFINSISPLEIPR